MKKKILISLLLILLAIVGRLLPHPWNATPMSAMALVAGAVLPWVWAMAVPILSLFISDFLFGWYEPGVMVAVYLSFTLVALTGLALKNISPVRVLGASLTASTIFFLITNFAVWAFSVWYPKTAAGLMLSYTLGLPFFRNMVLGDLLYTGVAFALLAALRMAVSQNKLAYSSLK